MKLVSKLLVIILLFAWLFPCISGSATVEANTSNSLSNPPVNDTDNQLFVPTDGSCLPSDPIFNNTLGVSDATSTFDVQRGLVKGNNGFYYSTGQFVKTRGQVDVPVYIAVTNYADEEREAEIALIEQAFPSVEILDDPTSVYNCHSYAWYNSTTSNPYWIDDVNIYLYDVHTIEIPDEEIEVGDIIVYFDPNNNAQHSAIITEINGTEIICRSKWGASVLCEHGITYVPGNYWTANAGYEWKAYRITQHRYNYESCGEAKHNGTCTICGYISQEDCNLTYTCHNNFYHRLKCLDCDYSTEISDCTYTYEYDGSISHTATCTLCNNSIAFNCNFEFTAIGNDQHHLECTVCGGGFDEDCVAVATYCGSTTLGDIHSLACRDCGNSMGTETTACTFSYHFAGTVNGVNTHDRLCDDCGYAKATGQLCMYKNGDNCLLCGTSRDVVMTPLQARAVIWA